ncbi:uncharacterized protein SAPINGB_P006443 [Magnusiomyces paraingens]|uniref:Pre-mRNA-splicing factor PRP46 n=1 Tax=Magnusiomyces paraingens TaxID=2606893 RepID=A0A5E8C7P4_9ASCO|nr:uncharacterized protein SAPINGB_P006443 [Saprochaete ingens]VVT58905.1 unnamed protein product [Saprochaete ingens]
MALFYGDPDKIDYDAIKKTSETHIKAATSGLFGNALLPLDDSTSSAEAGSPAASKLRVLHKFRAEYAPSQTLPAYVQRKMDAAAAKRKPPAGVSKPGSNLATATTTIDASTRKLIEGVPIPSESSALALRHKHTPSSGSQSSSLINKNIYAQEKPQWHRPWKLMRVINGHQGWVRSVCVEPDNQWFATGSSDRTIKIWDLASGELRLSLTGHIMAIRGLAVSDRHPYLFSAGEDKMVKCWDLETNKVVRHYHGHLSGVYSLALHPTLDVLVSAGNDAVARVWDIRTRQPIHVLTGHKAAITQVRCQAADPQVVTTSVDTTVRLWDLAAGKTTTVLTHHKKPVRGLALHPEEFTFATASRDNIKQWKFPDGDFMNNFYPPLNSIVNTLSVNQDGVMFAGADNGAIGFFDWKTGHKFQETATIAGPGSLESENGIFASTFDHSGIRLITGEADKSIKIWKEDDQATPESHPGIPWKPRLGRQNY